MIEINDISATIAENMSIFQRILDVTYTVYEVAVTLWQNKYHIHHSAAGGCFTFGDSAL